jgi:hypothetical protein
LLRGTPFLLGLGVKDWERLTFFPQVLHRKPFGHLKDEGAFQHKEFFALCPSENSWQIDAMNAKRKFQVFVILLLARGILVQAMEFA